MSKLRIFLILSLILPILILFLRVAVDKDSKYPLIKLNFEGVDNLIIPLFLLFYFGFPIVAGITGIVCSIVIFEPLKVTAESVTFNALLSVLNLISPVWLWYALIYVVFRFFHVRLNLFL